MYSGPFFLPFFRPPWFSKVTPTIPSTVQVPECHVSLTTESTWWSVYWRLEIEKNEKIKTVDSAYFHSPPVDFVVYSV